jgi:hypothetical protein
MMETHAVDTTVLLYIVAGRVACRIITHLLNHARNHIVHHFDLSIKPFYTRYTFHSMVRLDLPTSLDSSMASRRRPSYRIVRKTVEMLTGLVTGAIGVLSQLLVLHTVLWGQQDSQLFVILYLSQSIFFWYCTRWTGFNTCGRSTAPIVSVGLSQIYSLGRDHEE